MKRDLFIFLLFIVPLIMASFSVSHNENRYILNAFPAIFIISSLIIFKIFKLIKEKNKFLAIALLIIFIVFVFNFQFKSADSLIQGKVDSYAPVKDAGLWLNQNTQDSDIIFSNSQPQIAYYSNRETNGFPQTKGEFEEIKDASPNLKYFIISSFENHPEWAYSYPNENNLTVVHVLFADFQQQQPMLIIYELK